MDPKVDNTGLHDGARGGGEKVLFSTCLTGMCVSPVILFLFATRLLFLASGLLGGLGDLAGLVGLDDGFDDTDGDGLVEVLV